MTRQSKGYANHFALPVLTVDYNHNESHAGNMFRSHYYFTLTNLETKTIYISSSTNEAHVNISSAGNGPALFQFYEGTVIATGSPGTIINSYSYNRVNVKTNTTKFYHTPSLSTNGTLIGEDYIVGATGGGVGSLYVSAIGGESKSGSEYILMTDTGYMIVVTGSANATCEYSLTFDHYEKA